MNLYILDVSELNEEEYLKKISKLRYERVTRIRNSEDRKRSIGSELLKKYIVNAYIKEKELDESNSTPVFGIKENGKPEVYINDKEIMFNVSHSGKYVVAVIGENQCGVDIERPRNARDVIINRCFTEEEKNNLNKSCDRDKAFVTVWTMKESYVKMTGDGIRKELKEINTGYTENIGYLFLPNEIKYEVIYHEDYVISVCYKGKKEEIVIKEILPSCL